MNDIKECVYAGAGACRNEDMIEQLRAELAAATARAEAAELRLARIDETAPIAEQEAKDILRESKYFQSRATGSPALIWTSSGRRAKRLFADGNPAPSSCGEWGAGACAAGRSVLR